MDDILAAATSVLERYIGHDPEIADQIRKIIASARSIKECIQKVGEDIAPRPLPSGARPAPPPALKGLRTRLPRTRRLRATNSGTPPRWWPRC